MEENINRNENPYDKYWDQKKKITLESHITLILVVVNSILLIVTLLTGRSLYYKGALIADNVLYNKEIYRLITSMFLHADIEHLIGNMIMLIFVGPALEKAVGHLWFTLIYFISGIAGNLVSIAYEKYLGEIWICYGASGAVFGVIGAMALIIFFNKNKLIKSGSNLPMRMLFMVIYAIYSGFTTTSVNNAAHIGGLISGILLMWLYTLYRRNTNLEVYL